MSIYHGVPVSEIRRIACIQKNTSRTVAVSIKGAVQINVIILSLDYRVVYLQGRNIEPVSEIFIFGFQSGKINFGHHKIVLFLLLGRKLGTFIIDIFLEFFIFLHTSVVFQKNTSQIDAGNYKNHDCTDRNDDFHPFFHEGPSII
ncbi:Uncharacterised protein [Fusicatenibacter sp. 2789STDY5834925]|nr:Uncharacterised protein [Fusicatenibacter sp. 2789STDY5834925]